MCCYGKPTQDNSILVSFIKSLRDSSIFGNLISMRVYFLSTIAEVSNTAAHCWSLFSVILKCA